MKKRSTTHAYAILFLLLLTIPFSRAQTEKNLSTSSKKQQIEKRLERSKTRMQQINKWAADSKVDVKSLSDRPKSLTKRPVSGKLAQHAKHAGAETKISPRRANLQLANKIRKDSASNWLKKTIIASRKKLPATRRNLVAARTSADEDVPKIVFVDRRATGEPDGKSWATAYDELSEALLYAKDKPGVEEIWVAKGFYRPMYDHNYAKAGDDYNARDNVFLMLSGVKIYGGFSGTETSVAQRKLRITPVFELFGPNEDYATILSGDLLNDDYDADGTISDNTYHVVASAGEVGDAVLDGFIIVDGNSGGDGSDEAVSVNGEDVPRETGGGLVVQNSSPFLANLLFSDNTAFQGAAIYADGSNFTLTNSLIINNQAESYGAVYLLGSSPVITNATISANEAAYGAGGIGCEGATTNPQIRNTILYENYAPGDPNLRLSEGANASFAYSIVQGSGGSGALWDENFGTDLTGNLDPTDFYDPDYKGPVFYDGSSSNFFGLHPASPAINTGNKSYFDAGQLPDLSSIVTDQRGTPRIMKDEVDMGALESLFGILTTSLVPDEYGILYVSKGGTGNGDSWTNAAGEVADAIFASHINLNISEIWVSGGTYLPQYRPDDLSNADPESPDNSFLIPTDLNIYGGFEGGEEYYEDRVLSLTDHVSILSGDFLENDNFSLTNIENSGVGTEFDDNAHHLIYIIGGDSESSVDGFTIEGANNLNVPEGGTLLINENEVSTDYGAGIFVQEADPYFENLIIRNNIGLSGGGLTGIASAWTVQSSAIYHNVDDGSGAGIWHAVAPYSLRLFNSTVAQNLSLGIAPGVGILFAEIEFENSIIYHNRFLGTPASPGALVPDRDFDADVAFGSIENSLVGGSGGSDNWKLTDLANNLFIFDDGDNLDEDPEFNDMDGSDFSLSACSRAIDAGDEDSPCACAMDLAGHVRVINEIIDIGPFEFQDPRPAYATALAEGGNESSFVFEENMSHTFSVDAEVCKSDLLSLISENISGEVVAKVWVDNEVKTYNDAKYLQRHFDITPSDNPESSRGIVVLYFTQAEFDALNQGLTAEEYLPTGEEDGEEDRKANLRIYQFHGSSLDETGSPDSYEGTRTVIDPDESNISWNSILNRWEVAFYVDGFSGFFGGTFSQNPLPVRLVSFEGKRTDDQKTKLDWKVAEQENIDVYQVEYSSNGKAFNKIGQITANALTNTTYTFTDTLAHAGNLAYYRLKILELDGKTAYSKIVSVKLPATDGMIAYPVPAKNELWIDWKKTDASSVEFIDVNGRILKTVNKMSTSQKVDISGLPTGIFVLKSGSRVLKVVKE